ncbi:RDD family protein [Pantanalinema rosaneae CENA516]|uniref:RDD family protein n=1 Tax=Pantanalinema rosaneae TaxID=1620701 RepID=UPI003D6E6719
MYDGELVLVPRFPRVPLPRRIAAFAIDVVVIGLLSLLLGQQFYGVLFMLLWLGLRVLVVAKNKGQSLGRWALDMKVINPQYRAIPGLLELTKRETITGLGALLAWIGLVNLSPTNGLLLVLPIPLLVDCSFAFTDAEYRQAFHDRMAQTIVVQTRRGYSLDIKLRRLFAQAGRRMK